MTADVTRLYHRTPAVSEILGRGFRDAESTYMLIGTTLRGVWLSDVPLDVNEGAKGDQLLEVLLPAGVDLSGWEIVEDGKPYREWCVPANVLNAVATTRAVADPE